MNLRLLKLIVNAGHTQVRLRLDNKIFDYFSTINFNFENLDCENCGIKSMLMMVNPYQDAQLLTSIRLLIRN